MQMRFIPAEGSGITQAVRAGDLVFIGGLMPVDESGAVIGSSLSTQATFVFDALKRVLAEAGATLADVVKHNVYLSGEGPFSNVDEAIAELDGVRTAYFDSPGPTSTEIFCGMEREGVFLVLDAWVIVGGKRELLSPPGHWNWKSKLPFVHGWKVGDMIFTGGQRSLNRSGHLLGAGDIEIQTDEAFRNLDTLLRTAGGDRHSLMRQNTYFRFFGQGAEVTSYWEKMTNVRRRYMSIPSAAGAGLRVTSLPGADELIQVEGIGVLGENKQRLQPANHWDWSIPGSEFTQGWKIGNLGFIGGQISADNKAHAVGHDMETQTRNVFTFIRRVLAEGGMTEANVAKLYIYYHADGGWAEIARARAIIESVQREFYGTPGPAVTAVRVSGFAFEDLLIEIEAVAVTGD